MADPGSNFVDAFTAVLGAGMQARRQKKQDAWTDKQNARTEEEWKRQDQLTADLKAAPQEGAIIGAKRKSYGLSTFGLNPEELAGFTDNAAATEFVRSRFATPAPAAALPTAAPTQTAALGALPMPTGASRPVNPALATDAAPAAAAPTGPQIDWSKAVVFKDRDTGLWRVGEEGRTATRIDAYRAQADAYRKNGMPEKAASLEASIGQLELQKYQIDAQAFDANLREAGKYMTSNPAKAAEVLATAWDNVDDGAAPKIDIDPKTGAVSVQMYDENTGLPWQGGPMQFDNVAQMYEKAAQFSSPERMMAWSQEARAQRVATAQILQAEAATLTENATREGKVALLGAQARATEQQGNAAMITAQASAARASRAGATAAAPSFKDRLSADKWVQANVDDYMAASQHAPGTPAYKAEAAARRADLLNTNPNLAAIYGGSGIPEITADMVGGKDTGTAAKGTTAPAAALPAPTPAAARAQRFQSDFAKGRDAAAAKQRKAEAEARALSPFAM